MDLEDWRHEWNQPDIRITALKTRIADLKTKVEINESMRMNESFAINQNFEKQQLHIDILELYFLDLISKEEVKTLLLMLKSPDTENHTVAKELVAQKTKTDSYG